MAETLTPAALKDAVGISASYAHMILNDKRTPALPLAITIFRKTGHKFGPVANLSDDVIEALETAQSAAA